MKNTPPTTTLKQQGWLIEDRPPSPFHLPPSVLARYTRLPSTLRDFLSGLTSCVNPSETAWFLCEADFRDTGASAFCWNAWELLSLEAAGDDSSLVAEIESFWNRYFPFLLSVADGYSYYAIDTDAEHFGRVVMGQEPEFEEAEVVAESFEAFLSRLLAGRFYASWEQNRRGG